MTAERFSLDTNVLVYSADRDAGVRHALACEIVERAARRPCVLIVQALGEFYRAVTRKRIVPEAEAATQVDEWLELFPTAAADARGLRAALRAAHGGRFSFWDALFLATAAEAGCAAVISEDFHDGARMGAVVVRHPFKNEKLTDAVQRLLE
jgi:predicted nucleic acid-binding protein